MRLIKEQAQVRPLGKRCALFNFKRRARDEPKRTECAVKAFGGTARPYGFDDDLPEQKRAFAHHFIQVSAFYLERVDMPFAAGVLKEQFPDKDDGALLEAVELSHGDMELAAAY